MIVERGKGKNVYIRYRDPETLERQMLNIRDIYPYCFVEDESAEWIDAVAKEPGYRGIYGESLTKITMYDPSEIGQLARQGKTWEGNIPFVNRVLADVQPDIPDYKHRIWYLDGEWTIDTGKITLLTVYDNYTERLYTWFTADGYNEGKYSKVGDFNMGETPAMAFKDERSLLAHFVGFMRKQDPDVITGWYVAGADLKQIIERCRKNGVDYKKMSPHNRIRYEFDDWSQPIVGRNTIDLMLAFSKLWEMKNGKLSGYRLDDVAEECLGERKVELPDGHDTYYTNFPLYLDYNRQDVRLLPRLNALNNAIEHFLSIQTIVKCDIRTTPHITRIFTCLALQDPDFTLRIPSKPQFAKVDYSGADIQEPQPGLYDNVAIMDIKAMYHSNVNLHNISWETLDAAGDDCGNGSCFRQGERGLLGRQMDKMTELRNHYKGLMKTATTDAERKRYDALQYATKSLVASMYGCAGDSKYALYHPEIAAAITYTSRQTLFRLRDECNKRGFPVIYGHTDSIFCVVPQGPEIGVELVNAINETMAPIETEFERFAETMLISAKNRYVGNVNWVDGEYVQPQFYLKGMEIKQSRMPPVMRETVGNVLRGMLEKKEPKAIIDGVCATITDIMQNKVPLEDLSMKGKLTKDLSDYASVSGAAAGAKWANDYLGKGYRKGDFFKCLIDSEGNYIAFDKPDEIPSWVNVGYHHIVQRFILDKVEPYFTIAGWSMVDLENARDGKSGVEWL